MSTRKAIAAVLAIGSAGIGIIATTPSAEAYTYQEGYIEGYHAEIWDSGSYAGEDTIVVLGPNGSEHINVTCAPFDWRSTGPNSENFVTRITQAWCF